MNNSDLPGLSHPNQPRSGLRLWQREGTRTQRSHCLGRRRPAEQVGQLLQPSKWHCFIREQPLDPVHACLASLRAWQDKPSRANRRATQAKGGCPEPCPCPALLQAPGCSPGCQQRAELQQGSGRLLPDTGVIHPSLQRATSG